MKEQIKKRLNRIKGQPVAPSWVKIKAISDKVELRLLNRCLFCIQ